MDEKVILEKIKEGDQKQLAVVYRSYQSEFIAWLVKEHNCHRDEAKDIYQVSIIALYENIISGKLTTLTSNLKTYLYSIAKHKVYEFRRKENKIDRSVGVQTIELEELTNWDAIDKEKNLVLMEKSLEKLGDPCKTLLELYYFHGLSMEEIAEKIGYKNSATTKNLKCKCIVRLRKIFEEMGNQSEDLDQQTTTIEVKK
ncbi:MAG: RNA polymerase sigma factor [Cyclobacteriaceae bacterium]